MNGPRPLHVPQVLWGHGAAVACDCRRQSLGNSYDNEMARTTGKSLEGSCPTRNFLVSDTRPLQLHQVFQLPHFQMIQKSPLSRLHHIRPQSRKFDPA